MKPTLLTGCLRAAAAAAGAATQSADLTSEGKQWWAHVQFLADDKLEGRNVGTPGYDTAAGYVESRFQTIGLKPAGTTGFRQPVKLESRQLVPDQSRLALVRDGAEEPLAMGQDASLSARGEASCPMASGSSAPRSEEHTSELQSHSDLVCRLLLEKKKEPRHTGTRASSAALI